MPSFSSRTADRPSSQFCPGIDGDGRAERPPGEIVLHADVGRRGDLALGACPRDSREIVGRPLAGRSEIPFAIGLPRPALAGRPRSRSSSTARRRAPARRPTRRMTKRVCRRADAEPDVGRRRRAERAGMIDVGPDLERPARMAACAGCGTRLSCIAALRQSAKRNASLRSTAKRRCMSRRTDLLPAEAARRARLYPPGDRRRRRSTRWRRSRSSPAISASTRPRRASTSATSSRS